MVVSQARIDANRCNAQKSTGPKTPEGKEKSRANGLKHGLTGDGIVLPTEDAEELTRRFATLAAEMKPGNELARQLVSRIALMTIRLDRSAEHEAKAITHRMRRAIEKYDDARSAEVEHLYAWIAAEPATNARRLRSSPEGLKRLLEVMTDLRADLAHPDGHRWDFLRCDQLHHMLGLRREAVPVSRARALGEALAGNTRLLSQADGAGLDPEARRRWAQEALIALIDEEIARLEALLDAIDFEAIEMDRAEAVHRALFDASPAGVLARKYEATSERGLYRALKEFREAQTISPEIPEEEPVAADPPVELGSDFLEPPEADIESTSIDSMPVDAARERPSRRNPGPLARKRGKTRGLVVDPEVPDRRSSTPD